MPPKKKRQLIGRLSAHSIRRRLHIAAETPEQRAIRLEKNRIRNAERRASETIQQREERLAKDRMRTREARKAMRFKKLFETMKDTSATKMAIQPGNYREPVTKPVRARKTSLKSFAIQQEFWAQSSFCEILNEQDIFYQSLHDNAENNTNDHTEDDSKDNILEGQRSNYLLQEDETVNQCNGYEKNIAIKSEVDVDNIAFLDQVKMERVEMEEIYTELDQHQDNSTTVVTESLPSLQLMLKKEASEDRHDHFGQYIADVLRSLPQEIEFETTRKIRNIIMEAQNLSHC